MNTKQWTAPEITLVCKKLTLYSGNGTVPKFQCGFLKKECVHISAQPVKCTGTRYECCLSYLLFVD